MGLYLGKGLKTRTKKTVSLSRNGLLVQHVFQEMFDEGPIAIVRFSDAPEETELKVRVTTREERWLDMDLLDLGEDYKNRDLHNRKLAVLNTNRPAKRS